MTNKIYITILLLIGFVADSRGQSITPVLEISSFEKQHIDKVLEFDSYFLESWRITDLRTFIHPEGLNLPCIKVGMFNPNAETPEGNWGVTILLLKISDKKRVIDYFSKLEMKSNIFETQNFIVVCFHGQTHPYETFVDENQKFLKAYKKLLLKLENFLRSEKKKL